VDFKHHCPVLLNFWISLRSSRTTYLVSYLIKNQDLIALLPPIFCQLCDFAPHNFKRAILHPIILNERFWINFFLLGCPSLHLTFHRLGVFSTKPLIALFSMLAKRIILFRCRQIDHHNKSKRGGRLVLFHLTLFYWPFLNFEPVIGRRSTLSDQSVRKKQSTQTER
jgi:hypothetical protein